MAKKTVTQHVCNKEYEIGEIHSTLQKLAPLADLVDPLRDMVEAEKAKTWLSIQVASVLKTLGIVVSILAALFGVAWAIFREYKK